MVELTARELERQQILESVKYLDYDTLYSLDKLMVEFGTGLTICVNIDRWYDDCEVSIHLARDRLETDDEYEARIGKLKIQKAKNAIAVEKRRKTKEARKAKKEIEERKLYETLRLKFEKE